MHLTHFKRSCNVDELLLMEPWWWWFSGQRACFLHQKPSLNNTEVYLLFCSEQLLENNKIDEKEALILFCYFTMLLQQIFYRKISFYSTALSWFRIGDFLQQFLKTFWLFLLHSFSSKSSLLSAYTYTHTNIQNSILHTV